MEEIGTPENKTPIAEADTVLLAKEPQSAQAVQKVRTLQDIINELNTTYFFSYRRYRLKKEFLDRLRDSRTTPNPTLLQDFVLDALQKYVSVADRQEILGMTRGAASAESALPFAISRRLHNLQKIKLLVEKFKISVKPEWASLRPEDSQLKSYLQEHTPLYAAVIKKDVEGFKIALKAKDVKLTEYAELNIVDLIRSKIRENQDRNPVVRYFLNRKWNRMLRATTGQIKKKLFAQAKQNSISQEWLALFDQCPSEEIYYALLWYDHNNLRLYEKFKGLNLSEYSNIFSQMKKIATEEVEFGLVVRRSIVSSSLKIVSQVGGPVAKEKQDVNVSQEQPVEQQLQPDARTRFHEYLRENNNREIVSMLRQQLLSSENIQEVLSSDMQIDDNIKQNLQKHLELKKPDSGVRRALF